MKSFNKYFEYTLLRADTANSDILILCAIAEANNFKAVCVPPYFVSESVLALKDSEVIVCTVAGFPLGYSDSSVKSEEVRKAIKVGASEIDFVINIAAFKSGDYQLVGTEIRMLSEICHGEGKILKTIIESGIMNPNEIKMLCELCMEGQTDFVKTSTGFNGTGAETEKVKLMRSLLPENIQIKAAGGIKTLSFANELIAVGASRIGASILLS